MYNLSTVPSNVETLENLNDAEVQIRLPAIVFQAVMIVVGVSGNFMVWLVYGWKFRKQSTHKSLVLGIALYDTLACCFGIPGNIVDLRNPYMFHSSGGCKVLRFGYHMLAGGSAMAHLLMGIDRYRRICLPTSSQMSNKSVIGILVFMFCVALIIASPTLFFYDSVEIPTSVLNVSGWQCRQSNEAKNSLIALLYEVLLAIFVLITVTCLVVFYTLIGRKICKRESLVNSMSNHSTRSIELAATTVRNNEVELHAGIADGPTFTDDADTNTGDKLELDRMNRDKTQSLMNEPDEQRPQVNTKIENEFCESGPKFSIQKDNGIIKPTPIQKVKMNNEDVIIRHEINKQTHKEITELKTHIDNEINEQIPNRKEQIGNEASELKIQSDEDSSESVSKVKPQREKVTIEKETKQLKVQIGNIEPQVELDKQKQADVSDPHPILNPQNDKDVLSIVRQMQLRKTSLRSAKSRRLTLITFILAMLFAVSYVPVLVLTILSNVNPRELEILTAPEKRVYYVFLVSYTINNVSNPFVYLAIDDEFRNKMRQCVLGICTKCKRL